MSSNKKLAIQLENISKVFHLYRKRNHRVRELFHPFRKKYYQEFSALKNINISIYQGEIVGILGRNGSGKSTLLKVISRIIQPSSGKIEIHGRVVPLLELGAGFNPNFTGRENIYFYIGLHGYTRKEIDGMAQEIIDFAELESFIDQPLKTYSSGMRARLGFAVSINIDPDILIIDEVLAVGDEMFRRKCHLQMKKIFDAGKTVIYVSHSLESIRAICNRAILMHQGEVLLDGSITEVTNEYQKLSALESSEVDAWVRRLKSEDAGAV